MKWTIVLVFFAIVIWLTVMLVNPPAEPVRQADDVVRPKGQHTDTRSVEIRPEPPEHAKGLKNRN